jgi:uncharacterized Fe-S cluster-containing MiaB family protein
MSGVNLDQLLTDDAIDHAARVFEDLYLRVYNSGILLGSSEFRIETEKAIVEIVDGAE